MSNKNLGTKVSQEHEKHVIEVGFTIPIPKDEAKALSKKYVVCEFAFMGCRDALDTDVFRKCCERKYGKKCLRKKDLKDAVNMGNLNYTLIAGET